MRGEGDVGSAPYPFRLFCMLLDLIVRLNGVAKHFSHNAIDVGSELGNGLGTHFALALLTYAHGTLGNLFFANNEHVGDAFELVVAHLATDLFVAAVDGCADTCQVELTFNLLGVVVELFAHGQHDGLIWSEPQGELSSCVLDEHGHKALQAAEGGTVDHDRTVSLVVGTNVLQFKTFGQVVVHLNGAQLPLATNGVLDHEVELGSVESSLASLLNKGHALLLTSLDDRSLGLLPVFVGTNIFLLIIGVAERNLCGVLSEVEGLEDVEDDVHNLLELLLDLVGTNEDVGVVLSKATNTSQTMELATLLVAVYGAELCVAQRQVAIGAGLGTVDFAVVRAVHRLEQILLALDWGVDGLEAVLAILSVVTRGDVEGLVADVGSDDGDVAVAFLNIAEELLETATQTCAIGQPEGQTSTHALGEGKEFHFLTNLAVVAFLGLFEQN